MSKGRPNAEDMQEFYLLLMHHSIRLKVEINAAVRNALLFSELVGHIESDNKTKAKSTRSSAKGLYQFIEGSVEPAVNRLKKYIGYRVWFDRLLLTKDCTILTWGQQTLLFLGDILEKKGSDVWMTRVLHDADRDAMLSAYLRLHHTNPDDRTLERARRIIYGFKGDAKEARTRGGNLISPENLPTLEDRLGVHSVARRELAPLLPRAR